MLGNVKNPRRADVPEPETDVSVWPSLARASVTAGVKSPDVARMTTCWPPVPSKVYRSAKCAPPDVNTGDTQSPTVSAPGIGACPTAIGAPVNVLHAMKVPVKSSSSVVVKSRDGGAKMKLPRLGVARYVVPISNPVWDHTPDESVCTGGGTAPVPSTSENVTVTPARPMPPLLTTPAAGKATAEPARLTA